MSDTQLKAALFLISRVIPAAQADRKLEVTGLTLTDLIQQATAKHVDPETPRTLQ
jgi:hypothetical protein